jgi:hypothetical protein
MGPHHFTLKDGGAVCSFCGAKNPLGTLLKMSIQKVTDPSEIIAYFTRGGEFAHALHTDCKTGLGPWIKLQLGWNGDQMRNDSSINSHNHYACGAVAEWMYRYAAGCRNNPPSRAGFHTLLPSPNFDARLSHLIFEYDSTYGTIHSEWETRGDQVTWEVTVPLQCKRSVTARCCKRFVLFVGL